MTTRSARAIYAHVPFCQTICGYCDFYSTLLEPGATGPLVDALLGELEQQRAALAERVETIFVGGGTPTALPPGELARLLEALRALAAPDAEFTVEANPATVTESIAAVLAAAGVNRVSIGAQSFATGELRVLDRIHRPPQVRQTVERCRDAGVRQINLDLIFGIPGQTLEAWRANLEAALELRPDHLSCYGLTYEPGTPLHAQLEAGRVRRVDPELESAMFTATIERLAGAGFEHYEISNFARAGARCRHNLVYWRNEPCLGIGPSAAGYVGGERYRNIPDTAAYVRALREGRSPRVEQERLAPDRRARETAMVMLRLIEGIDRARFTAACGVDPLEFFADAIAKHRELGFVEANERSIRLTRAGLLVADSVIADFL
jgi:oxygen-independent coproporphyrinogen-3 oxidase